MHMFHFWFVYCYDLQWRSVDFPVLTFGTSSTSQCLNTSHVSSLHLGLSPVLVPSVSEAVPPAVHSWIAGQPPSPFSTENRSPPFVSPPLDDQPISPVIPGKPTPYSLKR